MFRHGITAYGNGSAVTLALILAVIALPSAAADFVVELSEPLVPDLAGDWRLTLLDDDNISREVNLTLYQAGKEIFGWGNMTTDNVAHAVVAGGSLEEDNLDLYLITEEVDLMFRFTFKVGDDSMSGNYRGYSSDGAVINGNGSGYWYPPSGTSCGFGVKPKPKPTTASESSSNESIDSEGVGSQNSDSESAGSSNSDSEDTDSEDSNSKNSNSGSDGSSSEGSGSS